MRLLLDEWLPRKLKARLAPHEVRTVPRWDGRGRPTVCSCGLPSRNSNLFLTAD